MLFSSQSRTLPTRLTNIFMDWPPTTGTRRLQLLEDSLLVSSLCSALISLLVVGQRDNDDIIVYSIYLIRILSDDVMTMMMDEL